MSNTQLLKVRIRDNLTIVFDGEVERITSYNEVGPFDVYPQHANFISILKKELTLYKDHQKIKELKIEQAILKVKQDVAHIFLGIETLLVEDVSLKKSS